MKICNELLGITTYLILTRNDFNEPFIQTLREAYMRSCDVIMTLITYEKIVMYSKHLLISQSYDDVEVNTPNVAINLTFQSALLYITVCIMLYPDIFKNHPWNDFLSRNLCMAMCLDSCINSHKTKDNNSNISLENESAILESIIEYKMFIFIYGLYVENSNIIRYHDNNILLQALYNDINLHKNPQFHNDLDFSALAHW
jgi:hypothetical protein